MHSFAAAQAGLKSRPQQSPAVLRCVMLSFESSEALGSETARVHHAPRRRGRCVAARGADAVGRARLAYWRDTLAADCRSVFYYFYKLKFQKNPAFARRFLRAA